MISVNYNKCTGCGACVQICPKNCITMQPDVNGFVFPEIDVSVCVGCGKCDSVCPIGKSSRSNDNVKAYAAVSKDKNYLSKATSGGAFGAIAEYVLKNGGIVYGCAYCENNTVKHIRVTSEAELPKLYGSKYVQSDTNDTFAQAKSDLECGNLVLYSGTPCQIVGLKNFLQKEYDNLLTIDLICHGVPSHKYFEKFVKGLEAKNGIDITKINFRSKKSIGFGNSGTYAGSYTYEKNGKIFTKAFNHFEHYYYFYFLNGFIYRESCYSCDYANINRVADFTIGDLWGAEGLELPFEVTNGCSIMLINNSKSDSIFSKLNLNTKSIDINYAIKYNSQLREPSKRSDVREEILRLYRENTAQEQQSFFKTKYKKNILVSKFKYIIPKPIANLMLQFRYKIKKRR